MNTSTRSNDPHSEPQDEHQVQAQLERAHVEQAQLKQA